MSSPYVIYHPDLRVWRRWGRVLPLVAAGVVSVNSNLTTIVGAIVIFMHRA